MARVEDLWFHDLRRTFATRLKEEGVDRETRRDLLNHSAAEMSEDYSRTSEEAKRRAVGLLAGAAPVVVVEHSLEH